MHLCTTFIGREVLYLQIRVQRGIKLHTVDYTYLSILKKEAYLDNKPLRVPLWIQIQWYHRSSKSLEFRP